MGAFGDYFGGQAKFDGPPAALGELAGSSTDIARRLFADFNRTRGDIGQGVGAVQDGYNSSADAAYTGARNALQTSRGQQQDYNSIYRPTAQQTGYEIMDAGSMERQNEEGRLAADLFNRTAGDSLDMRRRDLARTGLGGGGGNLSPYEAIQLAAGGSATSNSARYAERERGEAIRRQQFPTMLNAASLSPQMAQMAAQMFSGGAQQSGNAATAYGDLINQSASPLGVTSNAVGNDAYNKSSDVFNMEQSARQANTNRRNNMIQTGLNLFSGVNLGTATRGGSAGSAGVLDFEGGNGAQFLKLLGGGVPGGGGGGGGGFPAPVGNSSAPQLVSGGQRPWTPN